MKGGKKEYDINQLRDYSSLFSRQEANLWYKNEFSSLKKKLDRYDKSFLNRGSTYVSYLKYVYKVLERFYPNEYVYKNEFIKQWLLEEIGQSNAVLFNEFRMGKAVVDLAMFNGISKAFEIKTHLDKVTRLDNQLEQYKKLFNQIYVIVPEIKSDLYLKRDKETGVITYDQDKSIFCLARKSIQNFEIDPEALMQVLHTNEYIKIVELYYGTIPRFTDFNKFDVCKELIKQIPPKNLNDLAIRLIKERKINNSFSKRESQFNQIFLSLNYNSNQKKLLLSNLSSTID